MKVTIASQCPPTPALRYSDLPVPTLLRQKFQPTKFFLLTEGNRLVNLQSGSNYKAASGPSGLVGEYFEVVERGVSITISNDKDC